MDEVGAPDDVHVRPMRADDIEAVVAIESDTFSSPWKADTFTSLLDRPAVELLVMEPDRAELVGYAVLWCVLDQGELANVAVVPEHRGKGFGRHLVAEVIEVARDRGVTKLFLEVRASNERAAALYERLGFDEVGLRRAYYDNPREDARVMMSMLR